MTDAGPGVNEILKGARPARIRMPEEQRVRKNETREQDATRQIADAAKVLAGPWIEGIPPCAYPLKAMGAAAYERLTRLLFDQGKLKWTTQKMAELYALHEDAVAAAVEAGKLPHASRLKEQARLMQILGVAEDAPPISQHVAQESKFKRVGFAAKVSAAG